MGPPPSRRQVLAGIGGAVGLGTAGSTAYHAYTGPVDLVLLNTRLSPVEVDVRISGPDGVVLAETYDVPETTRAELDTESPSEIPVTEPGSESEVGTVTDRVVERATRGTTYTVHAATEDGRHTLDETDENTVTATCTGYVDTSERRLTDTVRLFVPRVDGRGDILLSANRCGTLW